MCLVNIFQFQYALTQLRSIYPAVIRGSDNMINFIRQNQQVDGKFDVRDLTSRYTCDVISKCVLDIDSKSFSRDAKESEIYSLGSRVLKGISATFNSFIKWKWIPEKEEKDFIKLMTEAIEQRTKSSKISDDFLQHIINVKNKKNQSHVEAAAHGWTFFLDSFETSGIVAYHSLHEIAKNQRVQQKLREEILSQLSDSSEHFSYETLNDLEYLDQVFFEILRLNPPFMFTTKVCSDDVELETSGNGKLKMTKGSTALISMYSNHRNPEYFTEPDVFNPERFDGGRVKEYRDRCCLLPFGDGPRICLGMRLGTLIVKNLIVEILKNFKLSLSNETMKNPKIGVSEFLNILEGKILMSFEPI